MQALSEEDRRLWMEAMDGREPVGFHGYRYLTCLFRGPHQFKFLLQVQNNFTRLLFAGV